MLNILTMVRLINEKNAEFFANIVYRVLKFQEYFTRIINVNYQSVEPCIYAMWHGQQCCVHGIPNREKLNILVSTSIDGDIITKTLIKWGFKVVRGSTARKGAVGGTMQIIERLKAGDSVAIMVDGPRGPAKKVKGGVVKIAQLDGVPIVPVVWYSPQKNFLKLPSWDKMQLPFLYTKILNLYGNPIKVSTDAEDKDEAFYISMIQRSLNELEQNAPSVFEEVKKQLTWRKTKN